MSKALATSFSSRTYEGQYPLTGSIRGLRTVEEDFRRAISMARVPFCGILAGAVKTVFLPYLGSEVEGLGVML
jgi:hypothetical protein